MTSQHGVPITLKTLKEGKLSDHSLLWSRQQEAPTNQGNQISPGEQVGIALEGGEKINFCFESSRRNEYLGHLDDSLQKQGSKKLVFQ